MSAKINRDDKGLSGILALLRAQKDALQNEYGVSELAVFGSTVNDKVNSSPRDLDLAVTLSKNSKTFDNYMELKFFLEKLTRRKVDLVLKDSIRKELKGRILAESVHV